MTTVPRAAIAPRLCGTSRTAGSIYAECGCGPGGRPIDDFIVDYPVVLPPQAVFPVPTQGVRPVQVEGVWHVLDRIGETHYPDPAVFIEEARAIGVSRKLPPSFPFYLLTDESMLVMVHDRGWVNEWQNWSGLGSPYGGYTCPKSLGTHLPSCAEACCAGIWWENTLAVDAKQMAAWKAGRRQFQIDLPCGHTYSAMRRPFGTPEPTYSRAIIARFPIHVLSVVRTQSGAHQKALARVAQSTLPWTEDDA